VAAPAQAAVGTAAPATVQVKTDPTLGPILANSKGLTLYRFLADTPGKSNCSTACAAAWPPLTLAMGTKPTGGPGVTGTLETITRADGTDQVVINHWPLYNFIKDQDSGDAYGQGLTAFGGHWYTVKPDGSPNLGMGTPMPSVVPGN
jgi:predicted lipoprotein with Yx(FWY)xxD motif